MMASGYGETMPQLLAILFARWYQYRRVIALVSIRRQELFTIEKSPSPAGRSPQRGRAGEGVGDIIDELKCRFFSCLQPSPHPLSQRDWNSSRSERPNNLNAEHLSLLGYGCA